MTDFPKPCDNCERVTSDRVKCSGSTRCGNAGPVCESCAEMGAVYYCPDHDDPAPSWLDDDTTLGLTCADLRAIEEGGAT